MTLLRVDGSRLASGDDTVVLRGFGLGGWMNMENFITGYAGTESQMRRALTRVLGAEGASAYVDRFLVVFFSDADAAPPARPGAVTLPPPGGPGHAPVRCTTQTFGST